MNRKIQIFPSTMYSPNEGDRIPADARLVEASSLKVNNASLTGESDSLSRHALPDQQGNALEALGSTTVVCTDKTGTITQNKIEVRQIFSQGELWNLSDIPDQLDRANELFWAFQYCHGLVFESGMPVGDPIETALYRLAYSARETLLR